MGEGAVEEGIAGTQAFLADLYKAVSGRAPRLAIPDRVG